MIMDISYWNNRIFYHLRYVYDPLRKTVDIPYEKCNSKEACDHIYADMDYKLQFSPEKVLRLVFHDCIPYKGENYLEGGCDGCLNLDENLSGRDHHGSKDFI